MLHSDRSANAAFFFWVGAPWYIKPLLGVLSDAYPLPGQSLRKSYLALGAQQQWPAGRRFPHLRIVITRSWSSAWRSILQWSSPAPQRAASWSRPLRQAAVKASELTSLRNAGYQSAWLVAGLIGGYLGAVAMGWTALTCSLAALLLLPLALIDCAAARAPSGSGG
ncbi:hypothetical protein ACRAWD_22420 [Caulobacter segnis]